MAAGGRSQDPRPQTPSWVGCGSSRAAVPGLAGSLVSEQCPSLPSLRGIDQSPGSECVRAERLRAIGQCQPLLSDVYRG